jgi:hypothetical protein
MILLNSSPPINVPGPDPTYVPGSQAFLNLLSGGIWLALLACGLGIAISSGYIALGRHVGNPHQETQGKKGVIGCLVAAFILGAMQGLISFAFNAGGSVQH